MGHRRLSLLQRRLDETTLAARAAAECARRLLAAIVEQLDVAACAKARSLRFCKTFVDVRFNVHNVGSVQVV